MGSRSSRPIRVLIGLLIFSTVFTVQAIPLVSPSGLPNRSSRSPPVPYGPAAPIGEYSGSGDPTSLLSSYNKTLATKTRANDTADFSASVPPSWLTTMNISFSDITARRVLLDIETNDTVPSVFDQLSCAMSFRVTNSCRLRSVMMKLHADPGDLIAGVDVYVTIYNASEASGRPKPNGAISITQSLDLGGAGASFDSWVNVSWPLTVILSQAETWNSYFFVEAEPRVGAFPEWSYRSDTSTGDRGYAWRGGPSWSELTDIDYFLNVSLWPLGAFPTPTQIDMRVNSTAVVGTTVNAGWWKGTYSSATGSVFFNVSARWPIVFNYTYRSILSYTRSCSTSFYVGEGTNADWNVTVGVTYPNVGADSGTRTLNFTIPIQWTVARVFNDSGEVASYETGLGWLFLNETQGASNSSWRVEATDQNYIQDVFIYRSGLDLTDRQVNTTDMLSVRARLQPVFDDGNGRLAIYNRTDGYLAEWGPQPDSNFWVNFSAFAASSYTTANGQLTCEVVWTNGWHVGVDTSHVWLVFPTKSSPRGVPVSYCGDTVALSVYYNDTFNSQPIAGAEVNVTVNGVTYVMTDLNNGTYRFLWDTASTSNNDYVAKFSANKTGYSHASSATTVALHSRTLLSLSWITNVVGYNHSIQLRLNYTYLTGGTGGIAGAQVNVSIAASTLLMTNLGNGTYTVLLVGLDLDLGNHSFTVRAQASRCEPKQTLGSLAVQQEPTEHTGAAPSTIEGGQIFSINTTYAALMGSGIEGATFACLLDDNPFTAFTVFDLGNGYYRTYFLLNVTTNSTFNIKLTASLHGFAPQTFEANVEVTARASNLLITSYPPLVQIYGGNFTIGVILRDEVGQGLAGAYVTSNWTVALDVKDYSNGTYAVVCPSLGASVGRWYVRFTCSRLNYEAQFFNVDIYLVWPTELTPTDGVYNLVNFENETQLLLVTFTNSFNGVGVGGGQATLRFGPSLIQLASIGGGIYRGTLSLTGVPSGAYSLNISAQAPNYQNQTLQLQLTVKAKLAVSLQLELDNQAVQEGTLLRMGVRVVLAENGSVVSGGRVEFRIALVLPNGSLLEIASSTAQTDSQGWALSASFIPALRYLDWQAYFVQGALPKLQIFIRFLGSQALAPNSMSPQQRQLAMGVFNAFIIYLLPWLVVVLVVALLTLVVMRKVVRPRRKAKEKVVEKGGSAWAQRILALMDLRALFVMHTKSGLPLFTYSFTGDELPSTLLSGFITAVSAFHDELSGKSDRETQLRDIHYKDIHLSLREGRHIISVAILEASPSEEVTQSLADFTRRFEQVYAPDVARFEGRIDVFEGADELVGKSFHSDLLVAHKCDRKPERGFAHRVYDLAKKLAHADGRVYLPQLFLAAVKQFGADKKFAVAHAIETLRRDGCLAPATPKPTSAPSSRPDDPPAQG